MFDNDTNNQCSVIIFSQQWQKLSYRPNKQCHGLQYVHTQIAILSEQIDKNIYIRLQVIEINNSIVTVINVHYISRIKFIVLWRSKGWLILCKSDYHFKDLH